MVRPFSSLCFALVGLTIFLMAAVVPGEASAHVAVHETLEVERDIDSDEPESHCHGKIECIVTLYPATPEGLVPLPDLEMAHVASRETELSGAVHRHDPPIPILS